MLYVRHPSSLEAYVSPTVTVRLEQHGRFRDDTWCSVIQYSHRPKGVSHSLSKNVRVSGKDSDIFGQQEPSNSFRSQNRSLECAESDINVAEACSLTPAVDTGCDGWITNPERPPVAHESVAVEVLRQGFEPRQDVLATLRATRLISISECRFPLLTYVRRRSAPSGIRTLVIAVRGQYDWPDYTNGASYTPLFRRVVFKHSVSDPQCIGVTRREHALDAPLTRRTVTSRLPVRSLRG